MGARRGFTALGLAVVLTVGGWAPPGTTAVPGTVRAAVTPGEAAVVSATAYGALLAGPPLIGLIAEATTLRAALWTVVGALAVTALLRTRGRVGDR